MKITAFTLHIAFILCVNCLPAFPLLAQIEKENNQSKHNYKEERYTDDDGTMHLRIEKYENGEKKVYERTYKKGEYPDQPYSDDFFFDSDDSTHRFNRLGAIFNDSTFRFNSSGKMFFHPDDSLLSGNQFQFHYNLDSLLDGTNQMLFNFNNSFMPDLDSLVKKSLEGSQYILKDLDKSLNFNFDNIPGKDFNFNWEDGSFNFDNGNIDLLLDKDLYNIEEVEKDGKKMLHITPKKSTDQFDNKSSKISPNDVQPTALNLNLISNYKNKSVQVQYAIPTDGVSTIRVTNADGKEVFKQKSKHQRGNFTKTINLSKAGAGLFTVAITHNKETLTREVLIK